jgi:trans-aconitate 2-methyltransferase
MDSRPSIDSGAVGVGPARGRLAGGAGAGQLRLAVARADAGLASESPWPDRLRDVVPGADAVGTPESYAEVLLDAGLHADVWETTYLHVLQGDDPVLEWIRGTGLRPILAALSPADAEEFAAHLATLLRSAYPAGPHGTLFPFRRVFAVGCRR